jgi:GNAT superfamily N-acetyltransferase
MRAHFPGRWAETTERYYTLGGTGREFVLLRLAGALIGFCRVNDDASPVLAGNQFWCPCFAEPCAGIGPLGIAAPYRGRGYGLAALAAGIQVLWERGIRLMVIDWTTAVDFYGKAGFAVWKSYIEYRREG